MDARDQWSAHCQCSQQSESPDTGPEPAIRNDEEGDGVTPPGHWGGGGMGDVGGEVARS